MPVSAFNELRNHIELALKTWANEEERTVVGDRRTDDEVKLELTSKSLEALKVHERAWLRKVVNNNQSEKLDIFLGFIKEHEITSEPVARQLELSRVGPSNKDDVGSPVFQNLPFEEFGQKGQSSLELVRVLIEHGAVPSEQVMAEIEFYITHQDQPKPAGDVTIPKGRDYPVILNAEELVDLMQRARNNARQRILDVRRQGEEIFAREETPQVAAAPVAEPTPKVEEPKVAESIVQTLPGHLL